MRAAIQTYDKQVTVLDNMDAVEKETKEHFAEIYPDNKKDIAAVLYSITKEQVRSLILDDGIRLGQQKDNGSPDHWKVDRNPSKNYF